MKTFKYIGMLVLVFTMSIPLKIKAEEDLGNEEVFIIEDNEHESENNEEITEDFSDVEETEAVRVENEEVLISDPYFRKTVNYNLGHGYTEDYNPSLEELEGITDLHISDEQTYGSHIYINDISGLELMSSLESIRMTRAFVPMETFSILGHLPNLKSFRFVNSYTSGNDATVKVREDLVNGSFIERVPFNPVMNLGALGVSNSIEFIEVSSSYFEYITNYQHRVRGELHLKGLENLTSLKELSVGEFIDVDDKDMNFVTGLENLQSIRFIQAPFTNIDALNTLPHTTEISINYTQVKDYSNVSHPNFRNSAFRHDPFVLEAQPYEVTETGVVSNYNTQLVIPEGSTDIVVSIDSKVTLDSYEIIDNILYMNVNADEFPTYKMYNPKTNLNDLEYKGFKLGLSYLLPNGMKVEYPVLIGEVSEFATFKLVTDDNEAYETDTFRIRIDDFDATTVPTEDDFGLTAYTIEGWYLDQNFETEADLTETLQSATTFYGKISRIPNRYTVSFESNGGSLVDPLEDVMENTLISQPETPTKDKHNFVAWYKDQDLTIMWNFDSDIVEEDTTLYAKWDEIKDPEIIDKDEPEVPKEPEDPEKPTPPTETPKEDTDVKVDNETPKTGLSNRVVFYSTSLIIAGLSLIVILKQKRI